MHVNLKALRYPFSPLANAAWVMFSFSYLHRPSIRKPQRKQLSGRDTAPTNATIMMFPFPGKMDSDDTKMAKLHGLTKIEGRMCDKVIPSSPWTTTTPSLITAHSRAYA